MPSFATLVVLYLLAFFLVYQRFRIARSNAVEPLKVRTVTPKKVDAVAPVMAEPLRAPVQSFDISVGAQKLSINDLTADVDDLISSFASFSLKARLPRSCCKPRSSCSPLLSIRLPPTAHGVGGDAQSPTGKRSCHDGAIHAQRARVILLPFITSCE